MKYFSRFKKSNRNRSSTPVSKVSGGFSKKTSPPARFQSKLKRKRLFDRVGRILILLFLLGIVASALYFGIRYVIEIRQDTYGDEILIKAGYVVGFDDVPAYPGAVFIFEKYKDDEVVRSFLSDGNSVYRLPPNTISSDVLDYYKKEMSSQGWEHINSVPFSSEEMMPGEYWIKEDRGVRIYSKLNDIWYESVSIKQANEGLSDIVKKEIERKLLLSTNEYQDLLPDFPWRLKVPNEYLPAYKGTELSDLQAIDFRRVGTSSTTTLAPIGYIGGLPYDSFLDEFLKKYNQENESNWGVVNSFVSQINGGYEAVRASLQSSKGSGEAVVVGNPRNSVVYVIFSEISDDPFLAYILENIEPANSSY